MSERVFVSYAPTDAAVARSVEQELREHGLLPESAAVKIMSIDDIPAGADVRAAIRSSIRSADMVVIVSSPDAARSAYVNYEAGMASALEKPVVILATPGADKGQFTSLFDNVRIIEIGRAAAE